MMDKRVTVADVVAELRDGMTVGIGGWAARRKPMALVRAICRSGLKDLTIVSFGGADVGMLCAAGKVKKLVFSFVSLDLVTLDPHFRAAREGGVIEVMEVDEGMLYWGLYAAGLRLPFLPTRAGLASDVQRLNAGLRTIRSPYGDDELLMAMPAINLDVALVHVNQCDARGNGQILGADHYFDDVFCTAAKRRFVSCERVLPTDELVTAGCIHTLKLNRAMVDGVVELPFGAHFSSCTPEYGIDAAELRAYAEAKGPEGWSAYRRRYIDLDSHDDYLRIVGGPERLRAIPETVL
ncbi:MAG: CoA transferase subunit A [Chloroflexota bacterium]|nr:CoA transferase subunit A [Chloroflexota bacterium]